MLCKYIESHRELWKTLVATCYPPCYRQENSAHQRVVAKVQQELKVCMQTVLYQGWEDNSIEGVFIFDSGQVHWISEKQTKTTTNLEASWFSINTIEDLNCLEGWNNQVRNS